MKISGNAFLTAMFCCALAGIGTDTAAYAQQTLPAIFPAGNVWSAPVDRLPVHPNSAAYIA